MNAPLGSRLMMPVSMPCSRTFRSERCRTRHRWFLLFLVGGMFGDRPVQPIKLDAELRRVHVEGFHLRDECPGVVFFGQSLLHDAALAGAGSGMNEFLFRGLVGGEVSTEVVESGGAVCSGGLLDLA